MLKRVVIKTKRSLIEVRHEILQRHQGHIFVYRNGLELVFVGPENYLLHLEDYLRKTLRDEHQEFAVRELYTDHIIDPYLVRSNYSSY